MQTSLVPPHRRDGRILDATAAGLASAATSPSPSREAKARVPFGERRYVDTDHAHGFCEFAPLEPGAFLMLLDLQVRAPFGARLVGEDLIEFHFQLDGRLGLDGRWGQVAMQGPSLLVWHHPEGHDDVWEAFGSASEERERSITLYMTPDWLRTALLLEQGEAAPPPCLSRALTAQSTLPSHQVFALDPTLRACLEALAGELDRGELTPLRLKARGYEVLALALQATRGDRQMRTAQGTVQDRLDRLIAQIDANLSCPPTLARLAASLGLSPPQLKRFLKSRGELTRDSLVRERRLQVAKRLLQSGELQVGQVAAEVGYAHHATFSAAYRRRFGVPPKSETKDAWT